MVPEPICGDILVQHGVSDLAEIIQWGERRRHGDTPGCAFSHAAQIIGPPIHPLLAVTEACERGVVLVQNLDAWAVRWLREAGTYARLLRIPGLSDGARWTIAQTALAAVGKPYDVWAFAQHAWADFWWPICHPYAAWCLRQMRASGGSVICSEHVVRNCVDSGMAALALLMPRSWRRVPDRVDPAMVYDRGPWQDLGPWPG